MLTFNNPKRKFENTLDNLSEDINELINSGNYIKGVYGKLFEERIKNFLGVGIFCGCASGTDALKLSLIASGINEGSKVLVPVMTAQASVVAILEAGMEPIFIDTDQRGLIDFELIKDAINQFQPRAILLVHLYGICVNQKIIEYCKQQDLVVIEDCAQSFGSKFQDGDFTGSKGDFGAHSFYPTKNLSTIGDAGGVSVRNENSKVYKKLNTISEYGWDDTREVVTRGFNSRIDEIHCLILIRQLEKFKIQTEHKKKLTKIYTDALENNQNIKPLIKKHEIEFTNLHLFSVIVEDCEEFDKKFMRASITPGRHYNRPLTNHHYFSDFKCLKKNDKFNAEYLAKHQRSLPFFPFIKDEEIKKVLDTLNEIK